MVNIFDFLDYKKFLNSLEEERSSYQRGFRSRIAEFLDCQNAYVSHVLNTHANFSLEQALKIAEFLKLNEVQSRFFVLLVEFERASTKELKELFKRDIQVYRDRYLDLKDKALHAKAISKEDQYIYYSNWIYPTVHMLVTIPDYRTTEKIVSALRVDETIIKEVILFLIACGLVSEKKGELAPGVTQIHLAKDSPHISQHHTNWRLAAIDSLLSNDKSAIHYSTVSSLSYEDADKLKLKLVKVIEDYIAVIAPSKEETLYNFNLDFYQLIK